MTKPLSRFILFTGLVMTVLLCTQAQVAKPTGNSAKKKIYYFELHQDITPAAVRLVDKAIAEAKQLHADYIVMSLDSYGGLLDAGDTIHVKLLRCPIPVMAMVTNNAASAGALIAISCDSIYMYPYAKIGAASVVDQNGNVVDEKFQAYMRGIMRSTAETNHRDPEIAEAMVQGGGGVAGIIDTGKILTFTTSEAILHNYCEGQVTDLIDLLKQAHIDDYEIVEYQQTGMDKMMNFLLNPVLRGLCITFIFLGLYFELQSPGIGLPLFVSIIGALLYFAPLYVEGLAANWEILIFAAGLILIILEIFVVPGFGITGILGIIFSFSGLVLAMLFNSGLNFEMSGTGAVTQSVLIVLSAFIISLAVMFAFFGRFTRSKLFKTISLETAEHASEGYSSTMFSQPESLIGKTGIAMSDLRPAGKVEIDNVYLDAQSEGDYILKGETVKIIRVMNSFVVVRKV